MKNGINFLSYRSYYRGHEIKLDPTLIENENMTIKEFNELHGRPSWVYCDTLKPLDEDRPCKKCDKTMKQNTPDACIGHIEGVTGMCCGHGIEKSRYVNFSHNNEGYCLRREEFDIFMKTKSVKEFIKTDIFIKNEK